MNINKSKKCIFLIGLMVYAVSSTFGDPAYAWSTYRHIYNDSSQAITFRADTYKGNVYFLGCPNGQVKNGPCTLPPHSSIETQFTEDWGAIGGTMWIWAVEAPSQARRLSYGSQGKRFEGICSDFCKYCTQNVKCRVNDPADLDIKIFNTEGNKP